MKHIYNDGGRLAAGFQGSAGDCVVRAVAIASGRPYAEVYARLSKGVTTQRLTRRSRVRQSSARDGVNVRRKWFKDYMHELRAVWTPTMLIGSGCKVHLHDGELPNGRLVVSVSKHYTAVVDGVIHDTHDPQRTTYCFNPDDGRALKLGEWRNENGICHIERRCVYGYWTFPEVAA